MLTWATGSPNIPQFLLQVLAGTMPTTLNFSSSVGGLLFSSCPFLFVYPLLFLLSLPPSPLMARLRVIFSGLSQMSLPLDIPFIYNSTTILRSHVFYAYFFNHPGKLSVNFNWWLKISVTTQFWIWNVSFSHHTKGRQPDVSLRPARSRVCGKTIQEKRGKKNY